MSSPFLHHHQNHHPQLLSPRRAQQRIGPRRHTTLLSAAADNEPRPWLQQRFEARRAQLQQEQEQKQREQEQQEQEQQQQQELQQQQPQQELQQQEQQPQVPWRAVALQVLQLSVAVAALILWPASLYPGGLYRGTVWWTVLCYAAFFSGGSVWRLVRFGRLAPRSHDQQQTHSFASRAAWLAFVFFMPVLHFGAVGTFCRAAAERAAAALTPPAASPAAAAAAGSLTAGYIELVLPADPGGGPSALSLYDVLGAAMMLGAIALNWTAARALGRAYDRVVAPRQLVTDGPYRFMQHPVYTSYMLLFCGMAFSMHSFGYALLALIVCFAYYSLNRVKLENEVLQAAFGERYAEYRRRTKLFVPLLF